MAVICYHGQAFVRLTVCLQKLIRGARDRINNLEQLMLRSRENEGREKDLGWDATSLREEFNSLIEEEKL